MKRQWGRPGTLSRAGWRLLLLFSVMLLSAAGVLVQQASPAQAATPVLFITGTPGSTPAGTPFSFTVYAQDGLGNPTPPGMVSFTSTDTSASLPAPVNITDTANHTFSATLFKSGAQSIFVHASGFLPVSATITVTPLTATKLVITGQPATATVGTAAACAFTVVAEDTYNNLVTTNNDLLALTSSDAFAVFAPATLALAAGTATYGGTCTFNTAGPQTITATDTASTSVKGTSAAILVSAAGAEEFIVTAPTSVQSGVQFSFSVEAVDIHGNIDTTYTGPVYFSSNDPHASFNVTPPSSLTLGMGTFQATLNDPGSWIILASNSVGIGSIVGTSGLINVPGSPTPSPTPTVTPGAYLTLTPNSIFAGTASVSGLACFTVAGAPTLLTISGYVSAAPTYSSAGGNCYTVTVPTGTLPGGSPANYTVVVTNSGAQSVSATLSVLSTSCVGTNCCTYSTTNCCLYNTTNCCLYNSTNCCTYSTTNCCTYSTTNCCTYSTTNCCAYSSTYCSGTSLTLSPSTAYSGQAVTGTACGFTTFLSTMSVTISNGSYTVQSYSTPVTASYYGSGCYTVPISTSGLGVGYYTVTVSSGYGMSASAQLNITSSVTGAAYTLTFSSNPAVPGTLDTATGCGFILGESFTLTISSVNSQTGATPVSMIATPTFTGTGTGGYDCYSVQFYVPSLANGSYYMFLNGTSSQVVDSGVLAITGSSVAASAASLYANPASVIAGGVTTLIGSGFGPSVSVTIYGLGGTSTSTTASGTFSVGLTVPVSTAIGTYTVTALDSAGHTATTTVYVVASTAVATPTPVYYVPTPVATPIPSAALPSVGTASTTRYFAAGYTGTVNGNGKAAFNEQFFFYNPGSSTSTVTTSYSVYDPTSKTYTTVTKTDSVAAGATVSRSVNSDAGSDRMVSAKVTSTSGIVAEEVITRTSASGATLNSTSSLGSASTGTSWYLAEGYTGITFQEYLVIYNPSTKDANVQIQYLPSDTAAPAPVTATVPANGQLTINVRSQYNGLVPHGSKNIGIHVTSDQGIAVDREMYWGDGSGSAKYGASLSPAISGGSTSQSFAMLPTSGGSQSFVTVLNPNSSSTSVTLHLMTSGGSSLNTVSATVPSMTRYTFAVPGLVPGQHGYLSATLTSTAPVVAEAALYLNGSPNIGLHPGTLVQGSTGIQVGAEADVDSAGGALQIFNPGTSSVRVQVTVGVLVASDTTVSAGTTRLVQLTGAAGARGVLVLSSGPVSATLLNGAVGTAPVWGGSLG